MEELRECDDGHKWCGLGQQLGHTSGSGGGPMERTTVDRGLVLSERVADKHCISTKVYNVIVVTEEVETDRQTE